MLSINTVVPVLGTEPSIAPAAIPVTLNVAHTPPGLLMLAIILLKSVGKVRLAVGAA